MKNLPVHSQESHIERRRDVEYVVLPEAEENRETTLIDFLNVLRRRRFMIIAASSIMLIIGIMNTVVERTTYKATTTILIGEAHPRVMTIQEILAPDSSQNYLNTQYEIIKSRAIAEKVVDALQLHKTPPAEEPYVVKVIRSVKSFPKRLVRATMKSAKSLFVNTTSSANTRDTPSVSHDPIDIFRPWAVVSLQGRIKVKPRPSTKLVDITIRGRDPIDVVKQVNKLVDIYVNQNLETKLGTSNKATAWLEKESKSLKGKINDAELMLEDFKKDKDYIASGAIGQGQSTASQRLYGLNTSYVTVNTSRLQLQVQINELSTLLKQGIDEVLEFPGIANRPVISPLKQRFLNVQIEYANLANKLKPKHPRMIEMKSNMKEIERVISLEVLNVIKSMQKEYQTLLAKEKTLEGELNSQKTEVLGFGRDIREYNALSRDIETDRDLYLEVSKRLAETTLTEALTANNIRIIEYALASVALPSNQARKVIFHVIFGLGFSVVFAFVADRLSKKFKSADEVEQYLEIPFLGFIPDYHNVDQLNGRPITLQAPESIVAESYRGLRTWIHLSPQKPLKSLLVTSAVPAEGKTTTAVNLAISFAQLGQMVLVVDADLRRPTVHRHFAGSNKKVGLTDILVNDTDWRQIIQDTELENLKLIPSGMQPPNPVELFSTTRMSKFIETVRHAFDIVIFDSPMVLSIPDVAILAPAMDGVIMVHYPSKGDRDVVLGAKKLIERTGATITGLVLNNVREKDIRYYYPYHYQRYYSYGSPVESQEYNNDVEVIDMKAMKYDESWVSESFVPTITQQTVPVKVGRTSRISDLAITVNEILVLSKIDEEEAHAGMCFLVVDLTFSNDSKSPHIFYPDMTAVMVDASNEYDRTLASIIELPDTAEEINGAAEGEANTFRFDPVTIKIERGVIQDEFVPPNSIYRGSIVYQVPLAEEDYIFKYNNDAINIAISFKKSLGNDNNYA